MIGLRAIGFGIVLASLPFAGFAQAQVSLAAIDRDLSALCARLQRASGDDVPAIRARLTALSRQRSAYLAALPEARRNAGLQRSNVSPQCLVLARDTAAPKAVKAKTAMRGYYRNGGGPVSNDNTTLRDAGAPIRPPETPPRSANGVPNPTPRSIDVISNPGSSSPRPEAQLEEFFPWPPPTPSDRRLLQMSQLGGDPPATWGHAADRLIALMRRARYQAWGFYTAPGGFAVIPRIEQLDDSGAALPGAERWATEVKVASTSLLDGILAVRRPKGVYRAIAFVVTTDPRSGGDITDPRRMLETARRWGLSGALNLPASLRSRPLEPDQQLFALVYEFESERGGQTKVNVPGRWDLDWHFTNAGLAVTP